MATTPRFFNVSDQAQQGVTHTFSQSEVTSLAKYINTLLKSDEQLAGIIPLDPNNVDFFFQAFEDGVLLCKLLNAVKPGAVNQKLITIKPNLSVFQKTQNLATVISVCKDLGLSITNIGAEDIIGGKRHIILALIWQIVRFGLLQNINTQNLHMNTHELKLGDSTKSLEIALLKWFNQNLGASGHNRTVNNFSSDIQDGENYLAILSYLAPHVVTKTVLQEKDPSTRANLVCQFAEKLHIQPFVTPIDILEGNTNLNLAFTADICNKYPGNITPQHHNAHDITLPVNSSWTQNEQVNRKANTEKKPMISFDDELRNKLNQRAHGNPNEANPDQNVHVQHSHTESQTVLHPNPHDEQRMQEEMRRQQEIKMREQEEEQRRLHDVHLRQQEMKIQEEEKMRQNEKQRRENEEHQRLQEEVVMRQQEEAQRMKEEQQMRIQEHMRMEDEQRRQNQNQIPPNNFNQAAGGNYNQNPPTIHGNHAVNGPIPLPTKLNYDASLGDLGQPQPPSQSHTFAHSQQTDFIHPQPPSQAHTHSHSQQNLVHPPPSQSHTYSHSQQDIRQPPLAPSVQTHAYSHSQQSQFRSPDVNQNIIQGPPLLAAMQTESRSHQHNNPNFPNNYNNYSGQASGANTFNQSGVAFPNQYSSSFQQQSQNTFVDPRMTTTSTNQSFFNPGLEYTQTTTYFQPPPPTVTTVTTTYFVPPPPPPPETTIVTTTFYM